MRVEYMKRGHPFKDAPWASMLRGLEAEGWVECPSFETLIHKRASKRRPNSTNTTWMR